MILFNEIYNELYFEKVLNGTVIIIIGIGLLFLLISEI